MRVAKIKLRMPHDGKVLGIDLDATLHEVEVEVADGVMTMHANPMVWNAMRRLSASLHRRTKKQTETIFVDENLKPVRKAVAKDSEPEVTIDEPVELQ